MSKRPLIDCTAFFPSSLLLLGHVQWLAGWTDGWMDRWVNVPLCRGVGELSSHPVSFCLSPTEHPTLQVSLRQCLCKQLLFYELHQEAVVNLRKAPGCPYVWLSPAGFLTGQRGGVGGLPELEHPGLDWAGSLRLPRHCVWNLQPSSLFPSGFLVVWLWRL